VGVSCRPVMTVGCGQVCPSSCSSCFVCVAAAQGLFCLLSASLLVNVLGVLQVNELLQYMAK
jgi:hypothetical protein